MRDPAALRTTLPADLARAGVGTVDTLVPAGVARDLNTVRDYDIARATELATVKVTADAVDACRFLTTNPAANRVSLRLDGGFH